MERELARSYSHAQLTSLGYKRTAVSLVLPARLWLGMAATQQGGRCPGAGRPRFVTAASRPDRAVLRFNKELHSSWSILKQREGFHSDSQFVAHLLSLEESRQSQMAPL